MADATAISPDVEQGSPCSVPDPYGIGRSPFGVDVFGSAMQLFDQIAARVLGPWRSDAGPANAHDGKMACRDRMPLSSRATLRAGIRTSNDCAHCT